MLQSIESLTYWFSFVNNNPTRVQKLVSIIFVCGMARMEMDYNLKKMANFFKLFLCILEKSLKTN